MEPIIDAHCHLDDPAYDRDREELIRGLAGAGVKAVINPASDLSSSRAAVQLAKKYPSIYACVGSHPEAAAAFDQKSRGQYALWLEEPRVVAVGEIGLDYHYADNPPPRLQQAVFESQLALAEEKGMPVVIHSRDAAEDTLAILRHFKGAIRCLLHSYNYPLAYLEEYLSYGYFVSIGGMVTFKNAPYVQQAAAQTPLDRILLETDGPYLAPVPERGRRNEPGFARYSLERIAEIREMSYAAVARQVTANAEGFYGIGGEDL